MGLQERSGKEGLLGVSPGLQGALGPRAGSKWPVWSAAKDTGTPEPWAGAHPSGSLP